jgi:hypothetical protein
LPPASAGGSRAASSLPVVFLIAGFSRA